MNYTFPLEGLIAASLWAAGTEYRCSKDAACSPFSDTPKVTMKNAGVLTYKARETRIPIIRWRTNRVSDATHVCPNKLTFIQTYNTRVCAHIHVTNLPLLYMYEQTLIHSNFQPWEGIHTYVRGK